MNQLLIKNGNKYGVRIKAQVPSINMLKTNINVEIAPIVGNKNQADDLIEYIKDIQRIIHRESGKLIFLEKLLNRL